MPTSRLVPSFGAGACAAALLTQLACGSDVSLTGTPASLVVSPTLLDLGAIALGGEASAQVTLASAEGTVNVLSFEVLNIDGDFVSLPDAGPLQVTEGAPVALTVAYQPTAAGYHWAELHIVTDEGQGKEHVVQVRGVSAEGRVRAWPLLIDFGAVAAGSTATSALTLSNEGELDLTVQAAALDAPGFAATTGFPITLPAGTQTELDLAFTPDDELAASASLTLDFGQAATLAPTWLRANDCTTATGTLYDRDADGIGWCGGDCDDGDASVNPTATESCNGVDDDCDGAVDEQTECSDDDGDGTSEEEGDCHDGHAGIGPDSSEDLANGIDDDCDGVVDLGSSDDDGDGFAVEGGDCDDTDASAFPGAPEAADAVDDDCDGEIDEGTRASDDDGDGSTEDEGDCDDTDTAIVPGAAERANWIDDDCDGEVDEGTTYADDDGDGFSELGGDCDDDESGANPGEPEVVGDGIDNDCNGVTA